MFARDWDWHLQHIAKYKDAYYQSQNINTNKHLYNWQTALFDATSFLDKLENHPDMYDRRAYIQRHHKEMQSIMRKIFNEQMKSVSNVFSPSP